MAKKKSFFKKPKRLSWDEYFFAQALILSTRSACDRLHTGTIIVDCDNRIIGAGYNGPVAGLSNCDEVGHLIIDGHCERTLHGEENALSGIDKYKIVGGTAYIIGTPCIRCVKSLLQVGTKKDGGTHKGLKRICYLGAYSNSRGKEIIEEMALSKKVELLQFDLNPKKLLHKVIELLKLPGGILHVHNFKKNDSIKRKEKGKHE